MLEQPKGSLLSAVDAIGPYEVEEILGRGAAGVVYRAKKSGGQAVAIKRLHARLVDDEFRRRFEREAEVRVQHKNVLQLIETGIDAHGVPFIVFELLEGQSLDLLMSRGPLTPADVVDLGAQACDGLAAAHALGIIHRDLKPANLFVCQDGTLKILDFGMALLSSRATRLTSGDIILGTPAYLSPEQAYGDPDIDGQTDIWALGTILYEALTGRLPFGRDTVVATIVAIRMDKLIPMAVGAPAVPPAVAAVVERALAKSRDARWRSAAELAAALRAADLTPGRAQAAPGSGLIAAGENRVVALLLAEGVRDEAAIEAAVRSRGGVVTRVYDCAIGLFGGDTWEGDETRRAAEAAFECRGAAAWMAVSSGLAQQDGTGVSGSAVRIAEQGCAACLQGIAVDAETARSLRGQFELRELGSGFLELVSPSTLSAGDEAVQPILGREGELSQLRRALDTVCDESRLASVFISGSPGMGKTRLLREIEESAAEWNPDVTVLTGRATANQSESALSVFRSLLENHVRQQGTDTARSDAMARCVEALALSALGNERARHVAEFLGELLGLRMSESLALQVARKDPQLMSDRLRLALQDLITGLCEQGPVALLIEDLHWADAASLDVIEELSNRLTDLPLLIVVTSRLELEQVRPELLSGDVFRIALRGLTAQEVATLTRSIVKQTLPPSLVRAITQHTAGNPLFVEQIVRALGEKSPLASDIDSFPLPISVQAAVQSRLDHLPPIEKHVCKLASVLGRDFFANEIEALGLADADEALGSLSRRNILVARGRSQVERGRKFGFKTALIADVAYRMLAEDVRKGYHLRAAAYLSSLPENDREEIADHYERGGDTARAAQFYTIAALAAAHRGDAQTVLRCSDRALELEVPSDERFALHMARADALRFRGRREDQGHELQMALQLASSDAERARVLTEQVVFLARSGRAVQSLDAAEEAVRAARASGDMEAWAMALGRQVAALAYAGRLVEAEGVMLQAAEAAAGMGPEIRAQVAHGRAQLASAVGDLSERRKAFTELVALSTEAGDIRRAAGVECNLADVYNRFGAYAEAEAELHGAIEGCRRVGNRVMEGYALLNLGYSQGKLGRVDEALRALEEAARAAAEVLEPRLAVATRVYRARVLLEAGMAREGWEESEAAATEAGEAALAGLRVLALTIAARALLTQDDVDNALRCSSDAMQLRDDLGGIEEDEVDTFLVHVQALAAAGRTAEADAVRAAGRERLAELAARITDAEWRARFLEVRSHRELLADA